MIMWDTVQAMKDQATYKPRNSTSVTLRMVSKNVIKTIRRVNWDILGVWIVALVVGSVCLYGAWTIAKMVYRVIAGLL